MRNRAELHSAHYGGHSEAEQTQSNEAYSAQSDEGSTVATVSAAVLTWEWRREALSCINMSLNTWSIYVYVLLQC